MSKPRIYFDDCERFNGLCYFPYHYFDSQWTWMPKAPSCQYCYSPKFDSDERQGDTSILISSNIYRIHTGFSPGDPQNCWIMDGTDLDVSGLIGLEPAGTATFTFLDVIPGNRNWKLKPSLAWNSCDEDSGMAGNNNVYIIAENGTKIGIHSRNETWYQFPIIVHNLYSYITINDVVQDSWYKHIDGTAETQPNLSWSYLEKIGNTYTYHIMYGLEDEYDAISATASLSEVEIFKYVAPTVNYLNDMISAGYNWYYTSSYGTSYIYKNLYDAGIDQQYLMFCNKIWFAIKSNKVGTYLKFCLGYNTWDEWEHNITINEADKWEWKSIDITGIPLAIIENGFKYIGFKYIHNELETEYDDFAFRYDAIYADPGDVNYWVEVVSYAFVM